MDASVIILLVAVSVFSVVLHEVAHGYAARLLGDDTAERAGRLTLNPIPHLDPIGSVLLPIIGAITQAPIIGWAKPVPYNPANLWKDRQWGPLKVALAGPLTNLALLLIFGLAARFSYGRLDGDLAAPRSLVRGDRVQRHPRRLPPALRRRRRALPGDRVPGRAGDRAAARRLTAS
jgi:Zn-dependent protease